MSSRSFDSEQEDSFDDLPENKNEILMKFQLSAEQLRNNFLQQEKLANKLELEKQHKELQLQNLQATIDYKSREVQNEKRLKDEDDNVVTEWLEKIKTAKKTKFDSALEYNKRMAELRNEVFSPQNLDDAKMNEEIEDLMNTYDNMCRKNESLQLNIHEKEKNLTPEREVDEIIDGISVLIKQLRLETNEDRLKNDDIQSEIIRLEEDIRKESD